MYSATPGLQRGGITTQALSLRLFFSVNGKHRVKSQGVIRSVPGIQAGKQSMILLLQCHSTSSWLRWVSVCWLAQLKGQRSLHSRKEVFPPSLCHKCWLWDINLSIIWEAPSGFTAKRARHLEITLGPIASSEKKASFPVYGYIWGFQQETRSF